MTAITSRLSRNHPPPALAGGKAARHRLTQILAGAAVTGVLAAALVAGLYYNVLQVNWGTIGGVHLYLKGWWDGGLGGLIRSPLWPVYRHGYRDQGEPELGYLVVGILIAKRSTWAQRAPLWYMLAAPLLLIVASAAGITAGIWFLHIEIPRLAGVHHLNHWWLLAGTVVLGFVLGRIVRPIWAPVGATINGAFIDRSVDRYKLARRKNPDHKEPFWTRHWWTAPLPLRERWFDDMRHDMNITIHPPVPWWLRVVIGLVVLLVAYLTVTGLIAHFWIGTGHTFPFLAPR